MFHFEVPILDVDPPDATEIVRMSADALKWLSECLLVQRQRLPDESLRAIATNLEAFAVTSSKIAESLENAADEMEASS